MSKKKMTGREVLEEALRRYCSVYCNQYPRYEGEIDLGDDYENYMNNLIKRSKNPFQRYFNTIGKRVAGIAAALLIVFSCSMTVSAVREPVVDFFTNIHEKFVEIFFEEDDIAKTPDTIETVYNLGYVPEGYELIEQKISNYGIDFTWRNSDGDIIRFSQDVLQGEVTLDYEDSNYSIIYASNLKIVYVDKLGQRALFWNNSTYSFSMIVSMNLSLDECTHLIESMTTMQKFQ